MLTRRNPLAYSTTARPTLPVSRARDDALIYTDSQNLSEALNRGIDKAIALEAIQDDQRETNKDRDKLIQNPPAPQQQQLPFDHGVEQSPTHPEPVHSHAANLLRTEFTGLSLADRTTKPRLATLYDEHEVKKDRDKLTQDPLAAHQQQSSDRSLDQTSAHHSPTHTDLAPTQAAELEIEGPEIELGSALLL